MAKLRRVEKEVLIPRHMEKRINDTLCKEEAKTFAICAKGAGLGVVTVCRKQYLEFSDCSNRWFRDEQFRADMEKEYLEKREHFRKTGKPFEKSPFSRL